MGSNRCNQWLPVTGRGWTLCYPRNRLLPSPKTRWQLVEGRIDVGVDDRTM